MFNTRHTKAQNVIEHAFRIMKIRWGILRSASFYPIKTQVQLTMTCFLQDNFIRNEIKMTPLSTLSMQTNYMSRMNPRLRKIRNWWRASRQRQHRIKSDLNYLMKCEILTMCDRINMFFQNLEIL